ncbi:acyl-CoA thioesterase [Blumeria hordei DH14]|uniref:Acyl-CoA thioesterase n=1 Tax=Blumeria graminis f. sp. hordei (strain DH14) TaxID=546991 RepID=N1JNM9_BLUG1|nr:acyl-CoA thioesterase [Blumeria hordei DH14]
MPNHTTLFQPPPIDPKRAAIENVLELTNLSKVQSNLFTNTYPLWHPPGARGVYGGTVIAHSLAASHHTVPLDFDVHSMHCSFLLAGDSETPIMYAVELIRDGKSYITRVVRAKQRGRSIFIATISFMRDKERPENDGVRHAVPLPTGTKPPKEEEETEFSQESASPIINCGVEIQNGQSEELHTKRMRRWVKARGRITDAGGHRTHANVLAYISDQNFIGTVAAIHNLWRFGKPLGDDVSEGDGKETLVRKLQDYTGYDSDLQNRRARREVGMMVSLDHSIYFHEPKRFRADEWILTDMESPWSGHTRGLAIQKMYAADGNLIATCIQEVCRSYLIVINTLLTIEKGCSKVEKHRNI